MLSSLYRLLTDLTAPFISIYLHRRLATGREDATRFQERLGFASQRRPAGRLIWCHAASVGEAVSLLAVVKSIDILYPNISLLVTTGTVTSGRMLADLLPPGVIHQYVPVDRMPYVTAFMDYWRPDCALWVESELWPNILSVIRDRHIPAILLNGRMSDKSFRQWTYMKPWIKEILSTFDICLTQTEHEKARFETLGARNVQCVGNLKYAALPLPYDPQEFEKLSLALKDRLVWIMASTHRGEESLALNAHKDLLSLYPNLLTIIVPRHAVRGHEIAQLIKDAGLSLAQRSQQQPVTTTTSIYLADTMGELGLFYRLASVVAMGGSFSSVGGHNPIEPAQLNTTILFGPDMHNFTAIAHEFEANHAAIALQKIDALAPTLARLFGSPEERTTYALAAQQLAGQKKHTLNQVLDVLEPWLVSNPLNIP